MITRPASRRPLVGSMLLALLVACGGGGAPASAPEEPIVEPTGPGRLEKTV